MRRHSWQKQKTSTRMECTSNIRKSREKSARRATTAYPPHSGYKRYVGVRARTRHIMTILATYDAGNRCPTTDAKVGHVTARTEFEGFALRRHRVSPRRYYILWRTLTLPRPSEWVSVPPYGELHSIFHSARIHIHTHTYIYTRTHTQSRIYMPPMADSPTVSVRTRDAVIFQVASPVGHVTTLERDVVCHLPTSTGSD